MQYLNQSFLNNMEALKEQEMLEALTQEFKSMFPSRTRILGDKNLNLFLTHQQKRARYYQYNYYDDLKRYALVAFIWEPTLTKISFTLGCKPYFKKRRALE